MTNNPGSKSDDWSFEYTEGSIPFTQYMRPHGHPKPVSVVRPRHVAEAAQTIIDAGYSFEAEVLSDDVTVSLTVTHPMAGDVAFEIVPNGPEVPAAVDRLILDFIASPEFGKHYRP